MRKLMAILLIFLLLPLPCVAGAEECGYIARCNSANTDAPPSIIWLADRETAESLLSAGQIQYYEPNFPVFLPEDTFAPTKRGVSLFSAEIWQHSAIRLPAQCPVDGSGITVGVLDSGVNPHVDFGSRLLSGYNVFDGSTDTTDTVGHGTRVAGMVASTSVGIAPGASIYPVKCYEQDVSSSYHILNAMEKAMLAGCDILNLSLKFEGFSSLAEYKSFTDMTEYAKEHGILIVAAVGNDHSSTVMYPAGLNGVIGVGAVSKSTGDTYTRAYYSQFNESVDIMAPGNCIGAPDKDSRTDYVGSSDADADGTSFASPIIAGILALGLSYKPDLSPYLVANALLCTARDLGNVGIDNEYGYGLADVTAFLAELDRMSATHMLPCPGGISIYLTEAGTARIIIAQYAGENELRAILYTGLLTLPAGYTEFDVGVPENTKIFLFDNLKPVCSPLQY